MKVEIELTSEQERFLKLFAANHYPGAPDNLATNRPIHVVQKRASYENEDGVMVWDWENVAFFFILSEAKKYLQYQRHNLKRARTFSYSPGYGNCGEYEHFYRLLFSLGQKLLDAEVKTEEAV